MKHVVMFSGGLGSFGAAERVIEKHGRAGVTLLFTDTLIEDPDLYRFLNDAERALGVPITRIAEGRTPWQVFHDTRFLANSRIDPCSRVLKREMADKWLADNCSPADTVVYVGIDWTEEHRYTRLAERRAAQGWRYEAPLCEAPYITKDALIGRLAELGIELPRLYVLGFPHNNCGGGCVKAGQGHFKMLLEKLPDVYAEWERNEQELRDYLGKDVSMLTDRRGGVKKPLTLVQLRRRVEQDAASVDAYEIGGCGCFLDSDEDAAA